MDNVIRPTFGARPKPEFVAVKALCVVPSEVQRGLHLYGSAAGHFVALVRDEPSPTGRVHRVVIGISGRNTLSTVAVVPSLPNGDKDAERIAFAVLHALDVVQSGQ